MGRGPRKIGKTPVAGGYGDTRVIRGKVLSVDKVKHTVTVQGEMNNEIYEGIQMMPKYLNTDGTGSFITPETNMLVWLCTPSSDGSPFIMGSAIVPKQSETDEDDPNDYRTNRPVLNEGDEMVASRDSGYIVIRKGGVVEIGGSQMARTFYIPLENLIHNICENFIIDSTGGALTWLAREEDETWGAEKTPIEFNLQIKEFADDTFPIVDLRFGRIAQEDDTFIPIGGGTGQIVARLNINEHYKVWIDKDGNCQKTVEGTDTETYHAMKLVYCDRNMNTVVKGMYQVLAKDRNTELSGQDRLRVFGNREVTVDGSLTETYASVKKTVTGLTTEEVGETVRNVAGSLTQSVVGPHSESASGGRSASVGENYDVVVSGGLTIQVANAMGLPISSGITLALTNGNVDISATTGTVTLAALGLPDVALARVKVKKTGSIRLETSLGVTFVESNPTGAAMGGAAGQVIVDSKGTVQLGLPGGGGVVTTQTHPFDYITGAPILGISTVTAQGIPAPGPAGVPAIYVPDLS